MTAAGVLDVVDRARLCADQGTEHLARLLRAVEQSGRAPDTVLREAIEGRRGFGDANSIAQVLSSRITGPTAITAPTSDAIPAGIPADHARHLEELRADLDDRRRTLGADLAADPPAWAVTAWGTPPVEPVARLEWEDRAGRVAVHREATGWSDPAQPLGPGTGISATERRQGWWDAQHALGGEQLRDEVAMTPGQLRARISAWEREQAWAPPHADTALRAAELTTEQARQDVLHATAAGEDVTADAHAATRDEHRRAAHALDHTARARAAWVAHTAPTRAAAERAQEEANRRGLIFGAEPDQMTPEEYLTADRDARLADDTHRTITDADVADPIAVEARDLFDADERSPHLDHPRPQPAAGAHAVLSDRPSEHEITSALADATAAAALITDRHSHDLASADSVEVAPPEPVPARRDLDRTRTAGNDYAAGFDHGADDGN